ncbi:MAG: hypothetical protein ACTSW3_07080 [Promethearchaeota archaeon]
MENPQPSIELEDQNYKVKNLLIFILVVILPFLFILILFIVDLIDSSNDRPYKPKLIFDFYFSSIIDICFVALLVISILIIIATYRFTLPIAMKKFQDKGYTYNFFTFFLTLTLNNAIVVYGFIIGIFSWSINTHVDWWKTLMLVGIGWIQMIYLYGWKIPKDYRKFSFKSLKHIKKTTN